MECDQLMGWDYDRIWEAKYNITDPAPLLGAASNGNLAGVCGIKCINITYNLLHFLQD